MTALALAYDHHPVPLPVRVAKHAVFGLLPGHVGLRNRTCFHHLTKKSVEEQFSAALAKVEPGDVCIDGGANLGEYTARFAAAGAVTHAFEPDPWSIERLRSRVGHLPGVRIINKALGTAPGMVPFFRDAGFDEAPEYHSLGSSIFPRENRRQTSTDVEMISLPAFLRALDCDIRVMKLDIEGAEVPILEALFADPALMERIGHIFVETHELQFPDLLKRTSALRAKAARCTTTRINLDWH